MVDLARDRQIEIDVAGACQAAGRAGGRRCRRIGASGSSELESRAGRGCNGDSRASARTRFRPSFSGTRANLRQWLNATRRSRCRSFSSSGCCSTATATWKANCSTATRPTASQKLRAARESLAAAGMPVPAVEAMARYDWVARALDGVVRRPDDHRPTTSDRIDAVLTHKIWGTLIFVVDDGAVVFVDLHLGRCR